MRVFESIGKRIQTLKNELFSSGAQQIEFNANGLSSGLYLAQIKTAEGIQTIKLSLVK